MMFNREPGFYWVRDKHDGKWEVARCEVSLSGTACFQPSSWYADMPEHNFIERYEIGPRIPTPDEKGEG